MEDTIILGDWGTTSCRIYLCQGHKILSRLNLPGIKYVDSAEATFFAAIEKWRKAYNIDTAILTGMVGSNIGWKDADYMDSPINLKSLQHHMTCFKSNQMSICICPGLRTRKNLIGFPDVMRGEETQLLGLMPTNDIDGLVCLPGTHTKWVKISNGEVLNFATAFTGELFDVLRSHSILLKKSDLASSEKSEAFKEGLNKADKGYSLSHLLMSVRTLQIQSEYGNREANDYLLGILVGLDVKQSLVWAENNVITIVGGTAPASSYRAAIEHFGGQINVIDGQKASLAGLRVLAGTAEQ